MKRAYVRFYAQLNDFLPPSQKQKTARYAFDVSGSVKDIIESMGVPHTEVDLILANSEPVDFAYLVQDGDTISVYPTFQSLDISPLLRLRPEPLREIRFVADTHLGRLAAYLRMLGFDTLYRRDCADEELARVSAADRRILLTRDRGLLMRNIVTRGYCLRETDPARQLVEVMQCFDVMPWVAPFRRCMHCNALLRPVAKESVVDRLLPETQRYYDEFFLCPACDRIYWKGSHYRRMQRFIDRVTSAR
jgi:uncharacterized protein with PIN domain